MLTANKLPSAGCNTCSYPMNFQDPMVLHGMSQVGEVAVEECVQRGKNLHDTFVRELREMKKRSGAKGPSYTSHWPYFYVLPFLLNTIWHRE